MQFSSREYTIAEVVNGYKDSQEEGVVAFGGKLNIRPAYQREFVYKDKQRNAVMESVRELAPLSLMYWAKTGIDTYEVLDGQQRTLSICQYVNGDFSLDDRSFYNLTDEEQDEILKYPLQVCVCQGTAQELLTWFKKINIVGEKLTDQELRNAVYTGPWLSDAKLKFSKTNCVAYLLANEDGSLLKGSPIRQEYLETAIDWISGGNIASYMGKNQHNPNAEELWNYFQAVVSWVRQTFPEYRPEMASVDWGYLYGNFGQDELDPDVLEVYVGRMMADDDVTKKSGIYPYLLTKEEKYLNIRAFSSSQKTSAYERQGGICPKCKEHFLIEGMEADHIKPWHEGGKTIPENCQMLCKHDNRVKSGK